MIDKTMHLTPNGQPKWASKPSFFPKFYGTLRLSLWLNLKGMTNLEEAYTMTTTRNHIRLDLTNCWGQ